MHDSAMEIGCLVINRYSDFTRAKMLEFGSLKSRGVLRSHADKAAEYVGLDLEAGPGVDFVVQVGTPWPIGDDYFDLVLAPSFTEHDPMFRTTFLQLIDKVKSGGYIYIAAAFDGSGQRSPQGIRRFYPDSGVDLMRWAETQGRQVNLIESFAAHHESEQGTVFVAIFQKDGLPENLPTNFIYRERTTFNVLTWQSTEMINPTSSTEQMMSLKQSVVQARELDGKLEDALLRVQQHADRTQSLEKELTIKDAQLSQERAAYELSRKELIELGAIVEHKSAELRAAQAEINTQSELLDAQRNLHAELMTRIAESEAALVDAEARSTATEAQLEDLRRQLTSAKEVRRQLEAELRERETATEKALRELAQLRDQLALADSTLRQRAEEIEQTRAELKNVRADHAAALDQCDKLMSQLSDAEAWVFKLSGERKHWEDEANRAQRKLSQIEAEARGQSAKMAEQLALVQTELNLVRARAVEADGKLEERLVEIGRLTGSVDAIVREAESAKGVAAKLEAQLQTRTSEVAELTDALRSVERERAGLQETLQQMETDTAARSTKIAELTNSLEETSEKLTARHSEIARLTVMLAERGTEAGEALTRTEWLRKMVMASQDMPTWWKILPSGWRRKKEHAYLARQGLFNAGSYLEIYPDVAQDGMDPVRHYIVHGLDEGRRIF